MNFSLKTIGLVAGVLAIGVPFILAQAQDEVATSTDSGIVVTEVATSTPPASFESDIATSTATSTEPTPVIEEEKLILQPLVEMVKQGSRVEMTIKVENLSCVSCDKTSPEEVPVAVYYTPWYPNDGPQNTEEADKQENKKEYSASSLAADSSSDTYAWSADLPAGHYYLVVVVDPDNTFGAYRMQRTEIIVDEPTPVAVPETDSAPAEE